MFRSLKLAFAGLVAGAGLFATGCASTPPQSSLEPSAQGITCTKCQVTWVKIPVAAGGGQARYAGYTGYRWSKQDVCPDCMDAVTSFFENGKFQHTCKTCGDTMVICQRHEAK